MQHEQLKVIYHSIDGLTLEFAGKRGDFRLEFYENPNLIDQINPDRYYDFKLLQRAYEQNSDGDAESGPCEPDWHETEFEAIDFDQAGPIPDSWDNEEQVVAFVIDAYEAYYDEE